ncbi:invasion associated locus B family protein [Seohaeicola sp. SP36]|uniref:invasion associated locus B family protein n=1 Tax=unclassified Seohaeicola TaxID=2641111 RepID=UPI00237B3F59|nr:MULTISPECIES: invasion associated locus B family protein [unclassified Seohaeicola]MDD9709156.1 invasion associated locus B family protein [Seohaeicola sp. 4SK31]MDD9737393.1 invasion associated locus B family protein [Seohaeicola sp. SP36]
MNHFLTRISIVAALAVAGPAFAQDTTTTPQTETPAPAPADPGLAMGETVADGPQAGQTYVREVSGDWSVECLKVEEGEEPCQIFQTLTDGEGNQVANMRIFKLPAGGQAEAGALVAVPLETLLTAQLTITVDGTQPKRYPFSVCDRQGCYARIGLTAEDIASYKRGASATVTLVPFVAPDERVEVKLSLSGFTAGYEKVTVPTE